MYRSTYIKKIAAAFLLMVFALSITPTIVFHNWLADHSDTLRKSADNQTEQIGKQTFNCHCDNVVAESPFTHIDKICVSLLRQSYNLFKAEKQVLFFSAPSTLHALRGPPPVV